MIFITAKFQIKPDFVEQWPSIVEEFTKSTRSEPGCLWFDWSQSLEDAAEFVLVEAFADDAAGLAHVSSPHFATARSTLPQYLTATPRIINVTLAQDDWSPLGEMAVD